MGRNNYELINYHPPSPFGYSLQRETIGQPAIHPFRQACHPLLNKYRRDLKPSIYLP
jgi:hypothetical protein